MAKNSGIVAVSALCFLALFGSALSLDRFFIEGDVYCDTCRAQFQTRVSTSLPGATVLVECKEDNGTVTFSKEAVTDGSGKYSVEVDGDHEEEICEVKLVKSSNPDCATIDTESHLEKASRVSITKNNGIVSPVREANSLGFMVRERLPICDTVLAELGLLEDGSIAP